VMEKLGPEIKSTRDIFAGRRVALFGLPGAYTPVCHKEHLPGISVPMLFIAGTRDPLSKIELLQATIGEIGELASLHVIPDGDHSFRVPKRAGRSESQITAEILDVTGRWMKMVVERNG